MTDNGHGDKKYDPIESGTDSESNTQTRADGGTSFVDVDPHALTKFQLEILYVIAASDDQSEYGLGIKSDLEDLLDQDVNHGRLYPNLDTLKEKSLIEKGEIDKRTNSYELTSKGSQLLRRDSQRRFNIADCLPPNQSTPAVARGDD